MERQEIRRLMSALENRVRLASAESRSIAFEEPTAAALVAEGFEEDAVRRMLSSSWWPEMVEEVVETPDFCEDDEPPERVLRYARDVVAEYVRKRFQP